MLKARAVFFNGSCPAPICRLGIRSAAHRNRRRQAQGFSAYRAYRMVQQIDDMYKCSDMSEAENIFDKLIRWLRRSRLEPMKKVASSLKSKKQEILNYFYYRMTNALAEGINSMIQSAKRRARGFRTFEGYACMIYLVVGKLNLSCPNPFS